VSILGHPQRPVFAWGHFEMVFEVSDLYRDQAISSE
jgi:hypothetical protein